jgi:Kdo2-lipid IVA lauroyltransferase/acyltransferase
MSAMQPVRSMHLLFRMVAALPLHIVQALGVALARLAFALSTRERQRLEQNLRYAGYDDPQLRRATIAEAGKTLLEMPWLWTRSQDEVVNLVQDVESDTFTCEAFAQGKGIIYLTPHLGSFEVAVQYAASLAPITAMYRPPRQSGLEPFIRAGRARGDVRLATADLKGVFALLRALRNGESVGILPDQVPRKGEGEWTEFFGRPAYTMTLTHRLQKSTDAVVVLVFCERLPRGSGYKIHLGSLPALDPGESPTRQLNRALEQLIRKCPAQYLWSYNRYKVPDDVAPPEPPADSGQPQTRAGQDSQLGG